MKKLSALILTLIFALCAMLPSVAEAPVSVYVTIIGEDSLIALAHEEVELVDADSDGVLTLSDALYLAHAAAGLEDGYAVAETEYGLSLTKLWGTENGCAYGYTVNNSFAMSLSDLLNDGDSVVAYAFSDTDTWTDTFCFFDTDALSASAGEEFALTLSSAGYDESWNPVTLPVEGAVIIIDGEAVAAVTDADGSVILTIDAPGAHVVSAVSDSMLLVPPVCVVTVE